MKIKTPFYERLADHIVLKETFDLDESEGGHRTIHELIAVSMLDNHPIQEIIDFFPYYKKMVQNNLEHAIFFLKGKGLMFYKVIDSGKKAISILTNNPEYRDSKTRDFQRMSRQMYGKLKVYENQIVDKHSDIGQSLISDTKRLTNKIAGRIE